MPPSGVKSEISTNLVRIIKLLSAPDSEDRERGLQDLHELDKQALAAVPALIEMLNDDAQPTRVSAARALGELKDTRATEPLIRAMEDNGDPWTRTYAAKALGSIRDKRAFGVLIRGLGDNDYWVRSSAAGALGELGDDRATDSLVPLLKDQNSTVRFHAAFALGKIADHRAVPALIESMRHDKDQDVRRKVPWSLGQTKDQRAIGDLITALGDEDAVVRGNASDALAQIGAPSVGPLVRSLESTNSLVRLFAARALGNIGSKDAVQPLLARLNDPEFRVRKHVVEALGKISDPSSVGGITARLHDESAFVRQFATEALGKIRDPNSIAPLVSTALNDGEYNVRRMAAEALAAFESPAAGLQLVQALHSENVAARVNAAMAMGFMHNTQDVEALSKILDDMKEDSKMRYVAAGALYQIGSTRAIDRLSSYLMKSLTGNDPMAIYSSMILLRDKQRKFNRTLFVGPLIFLLVKEGMNGANREWVLPALKDITGQDFGADTNQWSAWWERSSSATNESRYRIGSP